MIFARLVIFNYAKGPFAAYILLYITKSWSFGTGRMRNRSNGFRLKAGVDGRSGSRSRNVSGSNLSHIHAYAHTHTLSLCRVFRFGTRVLSFFPVASNSFFRLSRKVLVFSCSFGLVFIKLFDAVRSFVKHDILEFVRSL